MQQELVERNVNSDRRRTERLFHRDLPGGGYVAIELTMVSSSTRRHVRVIVERRANRARRVGHSPPVIIEEAWRPDHGFGALYRIACDNVAVARELLKLQRAD